MQIQLLEFLFFLPFVSGPAVIHFIAEKRKWAFTVYEKIVSGALLGNFVLVAPSIVVGLFSNYLNMFFLVYTLLSLSALTLFLCCVLKQKKWPLFLNIKLNDFGLKVYAFLIVFFALLVLFFHTLYLEYDALYVFFPYAKSIAVTGSMKYNIYDQTTLSTGMPPVTSIIYAWSFSTLNALRAVGIHDDFPWRDTLRPIPAAYFLLTALVTYLIARETLHKKYALLSVVIFMSFPSTILTLSTFSYYLDLSFIFYIVSTVLCLIKALKTQKAVWFFLTGVASSLMLLSKELAFLVMPLIFSMFILFSSIRYRRAIFVLLATSPFFTVFFLDLHTFPIADYEWILLRQLPVFVLTAILYYLSNVGQKTIGFLTWKNLALFMVPLIPCVGFFLRGIVVLDSLYSIFSLEPSFRAALGLFYTVGARSREATSFLRWDIPFLSLGLGVSYLIPIAISIVYLSKKRYEGNKLNESLLLMTFFTLLETMSFTSVISQTESRRMYIFGPMMAIFAAKGLMFFDDFLKSKYFIYLCTFFNSLAIGYIWLCRFPFDTMLGLSYLKTSLGLASTLDLALLLLIFVGIFLVLPIAEKKLRIKEAENSRVIFQTRKRLPAVPIKLKNFGLNYRGNQKFEVHARRRVPISFIAHKKPRLQQLRSLRVRFRIRRMTIYMFLFTSSFLLAVYPMIPLLLQGANEGLLSLRYDVYSPTWENGILIVSNYYNAYIDDDYVTTSFGARALRYFANRSVIDLAAVLGVQSMQNILTINSSGELWQALHDSKIRYFLIPRSNNSFYNLYLSFQENFYLLKSIEEDEHFLLVREFDYYQLFRFEYIP